ncbi:uncharacterized protein si:dkey-284p5.3 [Silurus meridionalis]|uniref:uncharacterized protein si:dkey-284p5.3 n=1 Tax=Silurus meridionalis TaxID=175797 RepID=UPI001EEA4267|nr:uncharacterized protein si:dkey-284p5.3 [Silurus meridionalis]
MGCNPSSHTTAEDTSPMHPDCNGATAVEKTENDRDIECSTEAAAESSEASAAEYNTLNAVTEPTPAEDQNTGAAEAGQSE